VGRFAGLPPGVAIRDAEPGDVDAVAALVVETSASFGAWAPPSWRPPLLEVERAFWWGRIPGDYTRRTELAVERDGGRTVGVVSWAQALEGRQGRLEPLPGVAQVSAVFVAPARWGQGIAEALLGRAERAMAAAGFGRVELWTPAGAPARGFYEAVGWRHDGREAFSEEAGLPLVGYAKALAGVGGGGAGVGVGADADVGVGAGVGADAGTGANASTAGSVSRAARTAAA